MTAGHPSDALVAFVDGSLPPREAEAVGAHVRQCSDCAGDALELLVTVNALRDAGRLSLPEPREIPALDLAAALTGGQPHRRPRAVGLPARRGARLTRLGRRGVAVAAVLFLGAAVGLTVRPRQTPPPAPGVTRQDRAGAAAVTLDALPDASLPADVAASARMQGLGDEQRMLIRVLGLTPAAPGSYYEVWLLDTRTGRTLPVGVLPAAGQASYPLPASDLAGFNAVDVSRQLRTGTGAHSGDSVLRGSLT